MNVIIPRDLRVALMMTTGFDVHLQMQVKQHEFNHLRLVNSENKNILKLKRDNMQKLFTLQHEVDVEEISLMNEQIKQETVQA
jgi:hypothetical protein